MEKLEDFISIFINSEYSWYNEHGDAVCYDYYKEFAETFIEELNVKKKIAFNYIRNIEIDAGIDTSNVNGITIDITEATLIRVYEFFYSINYQYSLVKYNKDVEIKKPLRVGIQSADEKGRTITGEFILTESKNHNMIAEYMSMFAMKFIILHEIGHLLHGHCDYAKSFNDNMCKFYMAKGYECINNSLESKTLEMDADAFAACALLDEISELFRTNDRIFTVLKEQEDIYAIYAMAIQGVFYLLENNWQDSFSSNTHPSANVRGAICVDGASRKLNILGLDMKNLLYKSLATLTHALINKYGWDKVVIASRIVDNADECKKIVNYFKQTLGEKLRPYTYIYVEDVNFYLTQI